MATLSVEQAFQIAVREHEAGHLDQAQVLYTRILTVQPNHPNSLHLLGVIARQRGFPDQAVELIRRSIALKPNLADAHANLGAALQDCGLVDDAIAANRTAIALKPTFAEAYNNLGSALQQTRQFDEAIDAYRQAIAINPAIAELHHNLATALQEKKQLQQALEEFELAIQIKPDYALAHYALGQLLLSVGDFARGWEKWEWRLNDATYRRLLHCENFTQPRWDGSPLHGRTLLLQTEGGLGDTFQFIRYVAFAAHQGGPILLRCPPALRRLLECVEGIKQLFVWDDPLPQFDVYCPMLSLPVLARTTLENIPAPVPYLRAALEDVERWRERLSVDKSRLKIGLVWAGGPIPSDRSIPFMMLAPLAAISDASFYSLQLGEASRELAGLWPESHVVDLTSHLNDFADTAGLIANLDLVISVDTAVLHLAGAMGKPVWALLKFMADCRWLLDRHDTPWYPNMQLFRQQRPGDWPGVISTVVQSLV